MNQLEHSLCRAVIAANGGYFDESNFFFLCINCLCNKICSLSILHSYCVLIKTHMEKAFFLLNWSIIQSRSETARLLVRAVVKNEPMGRQRSCTNLWRRFPPDPAKMGKASGYISGRFAIGSSDFFSFSDDDFVYTDPEAYSPLTRLAAGPSNLDLLGWSAFSTRPSIAAVLVPFAAAIRRFSRKFLPSFFSNLTSIPLQAQAIWSRSGEVTMSWPMTACHWQLQMLRSCRAR